MHFRILSHAGLEISCGSKCLLIDPWLIGSTYWRSWWNYPPVADELINNLRPSHIYLTHVHWDHFAGPSLRLFSQETHILIPREPVGRMRKDLIAMGFTNITELDDGASYSIAKGFKIYSYHFGPFTDSALVAEIGNCTLFNANDAKLMGLPLQRILANHTPNFTFRSHSSANSRACYRFLQKDFFGEASNFIDFEPLAEASQLPAAIDDRQKYIQDFVEFCKAIGLNSWFIPFASNHCYLHPRSFHYNNFSCTPQDVLEYLEKHEPQMATNLKIMTSGDYYNINSMSFHIEESDWFANRNNHLAKLASEKQRTINKALSKADRVSIKLPMYSNYFSLLSKCIPCPLRKLFNWHMIFVMQTSLQNQCLYVHISSGSCILLEHEHAPESLKAKFAVVLPLAVFNDCVRLNLFSHLAISKLAIYIVHPESFSLSRRLSLLFNFYEYHYLPASNLISLQFLGCWIKRWREVLLYLLIILRRAQGKKFRYSDYLFDRT